MKTRHSPPPALVTRWLLCTAAVLAGIGLVALAAHAAGSLSEAMDNLWQGMPTAPGFVPLVLGALCVIYGTVGLVFRREDE